MRGGSCRSAGRRECGREIRTHVDCGVASFAAAAAPTGSGTRGDFVGAPAGANAAVKSAPTSIAGSPRSQLPQLLQGGVTRDGLCRSAGRREGGGEIRARVACPTAVFAAAAAPTGGRDARRFCRSAGRREGGGEIRARVTCPTAFFAAAAAPTGGGTRGGLCRSAGRCEGGGEIRARVTCPTAVFAAAAAPTGAGRAVVRVGAPAGANAAVKSAPASPARPSRSQLPQLLQGGGSAAVL